MLVMDMYISCLVVGLREAGEALAEVSGRLAGLSPVTWSDDASELYLARLEEARALLGMVSVGVGFTEALAEMTVREVASRSGGVL